MLATQKGRSKPARISSSLWLKLMSPPGMRGGMIAELEGRGCHGICQDRASGGRRRDFAVNRGNCCYCGARPLGGAPDAKFRLFVSPARHFRWTGIENKRDSGAHCEIQRKSAPPRAEWNATNRKHRTNPTEVPLRAKGSNGSPTEVSTTRAVFASGLSYASGSLIGRSLPEKHL